MRTIYLFLLFNILMPCLVIAESDNLKVDNDNSDKSMVKVVNMENDEVKRLLLEKNQYAILTVHLKSYGDMLGGYLVKLRSKQGNRLIEQLVSDDTGVLNFEIKNPGTYYVVVSRKKKEDGYYTTVELGDFSLITKSYEVPVKVNMKDDSNVVDLSDK